LLDISRRIHDFFPFEPYHQGDETVKNKTNGEKIMFNRKVLVVALLAVVLLTSFTDGQVGMDRNYRHKPRVRKTVESSSVTVPAMLQASLENLMNQAAGQDTLLASGKVRRHPRKRIIASETGIMNQVSDQGTLQASGRIRRHPRKFSIAFEQVGVNQATYGISAADQDTLLESGRIRREPRKRRII
jgi:hypothetical protein